MHLFILKKSIFGINIVNGINNVWLMKNKNCPTSTTLLLLRSSTNYFYLCTFLSVQWGQLWVGLRGQSCRRLSRLAWLVGGQQVGVHHQVMPKLTQFKHCKCRTLNRGKWTSTTDFDKIRYEREMETFKAVSVRLEWREEGQVTFKNSLHTYQIKLAHE